MSSIPKTIISEINRSQIMIVIAIIGFGTVLGHMLTVQNYRNKLDFDSALSSSIRTAETKVDGYYTEKGELPDSLEAVKFTDTDRAKLDKLAVDYVKQSSRSYQLCGDFKASSDGEVTFNLLSYSQDAVSLEDPFVHGPGEKCFNYTVGSDLDSNIRYEDYLQNLYQSEIQ
jgi:type II secretory pathway pseudopilin PulG